MKTKPGAFRQRRQLDVSVMIEKGKLSAAAGKFFFAVTGEFAKAENPDKTADAVRKAFGKTGDTDFVLGNLTIEDPQGLFAPASLLNELRRGLYGQVVFEEEPRVLPAVKRFGKAVRRNGLSKPTRSKRLPELIWKKRRKSFFCFLRIRKRKRCRLCRKVKSGWRCQRSAVVRRLLKRRLTPCCRPVTKMGNRQLLGAGSFTGKWH